jgi:chorismate mutase / prephenate dehydratase
MKEKDKIQSLRQKIETVDDEILKLLNRRAQIVQEIGKVKSEMNMDTYNPKREEDILRRLETQNPGPFPGWAIPSVFKEIISACRSLEAELTVSFLGPAATFSHQACIQHFGSSIQMVPEHTIQDVFESVERGKSDYGLVPIENSIEGSVNQTFDLLIETEVKIHGEVMIRISHDLLSKSGKAEDVQKIYSHPQALAQCQTWLKENFPRIPLEEIGSTAKAAQIALKDPNSAAIAGSLVAQLYGLKVIESQIEDNLTNYTRFLILSRQVAEKTGKDKTSILISIAHKPGTLFQTLQVFFEKEINLTKIESRPARGKPWEYVFFIDLEGHFTDPDIASALKKLKERTSYLKILGSYPRDSQER